MASLADSRCTVTLLGSSFRASSTLWRHLSKCPASNWSLARLASTLPRAWFQRAFASTLLFLLFAPAFWHPAPEAPMPTTPAAAADARHHLRHQRAQDEVDEVD